MAPFSHFSLGPATPTAVVEFPSATAPRTPIAMGCTCGEVHHHHHHHHHNGDLSGAPPPPLGDGETILPDASLVPRALDLIAGSNPNGEQTQSSAGNGKPHSSAYGRTLMAIMLVAGGVLVVALVCSAVWSVVKCRRRAKAENSRRWPGHRETT